MSDPRITHGLGRHPDARFRCVVCRRFVKATERGACPTCGFIPPTVTRSGRLDRRTWQRALHRMRTQNQAGGHSLARWLWPILLAILAITALGLLGR